MSQKAIANTFTSQCLFLLMHMIRNIILLQWALNYEFCFVSEQASSQTPKRALSDSEEDTDEERDFSNLYVKYIPCSILFIVTLP